MKTSLSLILVSLGACALLAGAARWREATATPTLAPLDKAMHDRFEVPENFGMGRLVTMPEHVSTPVLSSSAARQAARVLEAQGWDVNFYLGGRELLDLHRKIRSIGAGRLAPQSAQQSRQWSLLRSSPHLRLVNQPFRDLRGPVALMPTAGQDAPDRDEVGALAKLALQADNPRGYRGYVGEWKLAAYPVPATKQACVDCHNSPENRRQLGRPVKVGDTLGVTVYAFRHAK